MTMRIVTAMFDSRAAAQAAADELLRDSSLGRPVVEVLPAEGATDDASSPHQESGFLGALKSLFLPEEDRNAYAEGLRRGGIMVSAKIEEACFDRAADILERHGAFDLEAQEGSWKRQGTTGHNAADKSAAPTTGTSAPTAGTAIGSAQEAHIPVVEERLQVGKREVERGRVRVRSYIVETPVEEQVTLHEQHVSVDRRAVDRPVSAADSDAFRERTIEATETAEEPVVAKEARVTEEVVVRKAAEERVETVHDTVRRTEVEVDDRTSGSTATNTTKGTPSPKPGERTS
jgi:uncharacterized protein (TIGR02271 family)